MLPNACIDLKCGSKEKASEIVVHLHNVISDSSLY